jgi:isopropylmalate/homocitrate/citramalate synthase
MEKGTVSDEDIALIRQHITNSVNHTEDFKILVRDSFDLSGAEVEQFMQHLKALDSNMGKHKELLEELEDAGMATMGDYKNMIKQVSKKIAFHEKSALGFLKVD